MSLILHADDLRRYRVGPAPGPQGGEINYIQSQEHCKLFLTGHTSVGPNQEQVNGSVS